MRIIIIIIIIIINSIIIIQGQPLLTYGAILSNTAKSASKAGNQNLAKTTAREQVRTRKLKQMHANSCYSYQQRQTGATAISRGY